MYDALEFEYVNHKGEKHTYKVIPIEMGWQRCKCFPNDPERHSWGIRALVLVRSGVVRNVVRSFAIAKMNNVREVQLAESV